MKPRVVAVIPAYNEERTLGEVLDTVAHSPEIDATVVISDGSTDLTATVARRKGAVCIELEQNVGKGGALKAGIDQADADVYVFLDADLIGLKPAHVGALLAPVLAGEAEMAVGILDHGRAATDLAQWMVPNLSGQRAVTRRALQGMSGLEAARYGVEVAMTRHIKKQRLPVAAVPLECLTHIMKEEKLGLLRGFLARLKMYWEIVKVVGE